MVKLQTFLYPDGFSAKFLNYFLFARVEDYLRDLLFRFLWGKCCGKFQQWKPKGANIKLQTAEVFTSLYFVSYSFRMRWVKDHPIKADKSFTDTALNRPRAL